MAREPFHQASHPILLLFSGFPLISRFLSYFSLGKSAEGIATHELSTTTSREILGAVRRCAQPLVPSPPALASQAPLGSLLVLFPSSWVCFVQQQLPTSTSSLPHPRYNLLST
ncbi:hypothetical protein CDL15_Pgr019841 [Punica granatum]|uniref:Uncharacterized protein n=1 Tax=Punica granatum TaxID=22663 RepID=A0A218XQ30_PUNGR|nr:hypothetical protein CDL15_Pgr019841 [Punica granatum]